MNVESAASSPEIAEIERVVVVVPAHNEEETLRGCLDSILAAARFVDVVVEVVLVLDDCSDSSAQIANTYPGVQTIGITAASVGAARAAGAAQALAGRTSAELHRTWLASTDADSAVPPTWLLAHLDAAAAGADAVIGAVVPILDDLDERRAAAWRARHGPGATLGHVHGANLGVRASVYRTVGGFLPSAEDEDVELVRTLRAADAAIVEMEEHPVLTSARLRGRVSRGYAAYLDALG